MYNNRMEETTTPQKPARSDTPRPRRRFQTTRLGLLVVGIAFLAGFIGSWVENFTDTELSPLNTVINDAKDDGNKVVTANEESIASVASKVAPSVVSIVTSSSKASGFYHQSVRQEGAGTGMIVSSNGYILTNKHVINGADSVNVIMQSGKIYKNVQVLGSDPLNDVAFLKIAHATDLPTVTLGDSKTVRIGQSVVAIGNALGQYQNTVTSGIISGTGRPVVASDGTSSGNAESLSDLLQTDAAINSGNSGGPLLNLKGQVIGINTAIAQDAQSIGFAIPIGATKGMLHHLVKTGKLERAYLGVQYIPITPEVKDEYNLSVDQGDYITAQKGSGVLANGPAAKAGISDKDIITKVNDYKIGEVASVSSLVSEYQPGEQVTITFLHNGTTKKVQVTLGTYKD